MPSQGADAAIGWRMLRHCNILQPCAAKPGLDIEIEFESFPVGRVVDWTAWITHVEIQATTGEIWWPSDGHTRTHCWPLKQALKTGAEASASLYNCRVLTAYWRQNNCVRSSTPNYGTVLESLPNRDFSCMLRHKASGRRNPSSARIFFCFPENVLGKYSQNLFLFQFNYTKVKQKGAGHGLRPLLGVAPALCLQHETDSLSNGQAKTRGLQNQKSRYSSISSISAIYQSEWRNLPLVQV